MLSISICEQQQNGGVEELGDEHTFLNIQSLLTFRVIANELNETHVHRSQEEVDKYDGEGHHL